MSEPVIASVRLVAIHPDLNRVRAALADLAARTVQEPGCLLFTLHEVAESPGEFMLWEQFANREAFEAHLNADYTRDYFAGEYTHVIESTRLRPFTAGMGARSG